MQDLWRLSAADIAALIRSKKVSAKEAATAALARLDAVNPKINAVVDHRPADVLAEAAAIDAAIARGEDAGPLAGVPVTVKVNIDQEGFATTNGLKLQRDVIARSNSPVIDNLRKAGAVILGRTNCPAFSYRWFTTNLIHGDTKNPRDPGITPGGSSGGAGAAVAAGIGHIAHGTDIAGSIRYPAYACGVHGLRPTVGRVAAFNAALPERTIGPQICAVSGPLARTIGDLRIALAAMSGEGRARSLVGAGAAGRPGDAEARRAVPPSRRPRDRAEVKAAVADAGKRLERAGWMVEEIETTPPLREAADLQTKLWLGDGYEAQLAAAEREGDPGALACLRGNRPKVFPFDALRLESADAARDADARMAAVLRELCRAADAGIRRTAVPRSSRPQGRGLLRAGMAGAAAADRHSLHGAARANGLHRTGRARSRRRSGGLRPLPRGSLPCSPARRSRPAERRRRRSIRPAEQKTLNREHDGGIYDFTAQSLAGEDVPLKRFEGQVLLIVNTASACGFTPQYKGLEQLHRDFSPRGFSVLGFPCNQFGGQEPGDAKQIEHSARAIMTSPFRCSPRSTSMAARRIRCSTI